jgi:carbonic anhydrase/acetyltransferase-like protein (isoleucine patch superfamily)
MGAVILDHAEIGDDSIVAAGSLITKEKKFPPRSLIQGAPAKVVRQLTDEEIGMLLASSSNYVNDAKHYNDEFDQLFLDHDHDCDDDDCEGEE